MTKKTYLTIIFSVLTILIAVFTFNSSYSNCMDATKHNYITQDGADHIASQCKAFIKDKAMVK